MEDCKHPAAESLLLCSMMEDCPDCGVLLKAVECKGCQKREITDDKPSYHPWWRKDHYDIPTGHYCDDCYGTDKYPFKMNDYFDPSYAGERMDEDDF